MKIILPILLASTLALSGCASSQKVDVVQVGDQSLSCSDVTKKIEELNTVKLANDENKGVTGKNVAAALFFWPALAYTYLDAKDAEKVISERKSHLVKIANAKGC